MAKKTTKKTSKKTSKAAAATYVQRADFGASADPYYKKIAPAELNAAGAKLRTIVKKAAPRATEAIKWGMPMYESGGMLCYLKACRGYLRFGFYGQDAGGTDPDKLCGGEGKSLRNIRVTSAADIRPALLTTWIKQAAKVNAAK